MWTKSCVVMAALCVALPARGAAPPPRRHAAPEYDEYADSAELEPPPSAVSPKLAKPPGLGAALEGYAGIALLVGPGDTRSRALVGGVFRLRYQYVQVGASIEGSDSGQADALQEALEEHWRTWSAFAGAWLPFDHFVDLDASVGYARRNFANADPIYGPNGFDIGGSALALRFGISDRSGERRFGARLGAALLGTIDLEKLSAPYERTYRLAGGGLGVTRGTTDVGGVSISLVVSGALELGGGARRD